MGGGLVRSAGGWAAVRELRHGREGYASDERILGGTDFVLSVLKELEKQEAHHRSRRVWSLDAVSLIEQLAKAEGMTPERIRGVGRPRDVSRVRDGIAYLWVEYLGGSGRALARELGLRPESVNRAARRGQEQAEYWHKILKI
jgi:chromosomal replication initiation ATPase DnaA